MDGMVVAKSGAAVTGRVIVAKDATHFSGSSELSIELTRIDTVDHPVDVVTDAYDKKGAGRGKNTALKTGGGAAVGAVLGGLLGGGKGAAIGAASGGGLGAGVNGVTKGQQVQIPTETLVTFHLQSPISVNTSKKVGWLAGRGRFATAGVTGVEGCGIPLKPKYGLTPISCHAVPERSACAPFIKERRMECINATKLRRKSGQWGTRLL